MEIGAKVAFQGRSATVLLVSADGTHVQIKWDDEDGALYLPIADLDTRAEVES